MKGTHLGEFEELVLLTVGTLYDDAYGLGITDEIDRTADAAAHWPHRHRQLSA